MLLCLFVSFRCSVGACTLPRPLPRSLSALQCCNAPSVNDRPPASEGQTGAQVESRRCPAQLPIHPAAASLPLRSHAQHVRACVTSRPGGQCVPGDAARGAMMSRWATKQITLACGRENRGVLRAQRGERTSGESRNESGGCLPRGKGRGGEEAGKRAS